MTEIKHHYQAVIASLLFLLVIFAVLGQAIAGQPSEYRLGPGDILEVSVWKEKELSRLVVIRPDGYISFPLAGEVLAAGRTVPEVQKEIAQKIEAYIPDTSVAVMLNQLRSRTIYVLGKVAKPGMFIMDGEMRVMQALALAGGLIRFADENYILILREEAEGLVSYQFDYEDVAKGENLQLNIPLRAGDTVVVP
jgi:polysaccharide export outer membrane protein